MRAVRTALAPWLLVAGWSFLAALPAAAQKQTAPKGLRLEERLTEDDGKDPARPTSYHKLHVFKMQAGKTYRIDMLSKEIDPFLRLEDPSGKQVAFNDNRAQGTLDACIVHTADRSGIYRIIATTNRPNETGSYLLLVNEAVPFNPLFAKALGLANRSPAERKQILDELQQDFRKRKKNLNARDVSLVVQVGRSLEARDREAAAQVYATLGSVLRRASDKRVAQSGRLIEGMGRRLRLPGKEIDVKGTTLDGKDLDWGAYRGKVVLVDFWATWCPPCLKELPALRQLYKTYHPRGFEVVAISQDHTRALLKRFLDQQKLPWVCLYDEGPEQGVHPLAMHYGIISIPTAILVDREGRVVSVNARGPELRRLLEKFLGPAEKP